MDISITNLNLQNLVEDDLKVKALLKAFESGLGIEDACLVAGIDQDKFWYDVQTSGYFSDKVKFARHKPSILVAMRIHDVIQNITDIKILEKFINTETQRLAADSSLTRHYDTIDEDEVAINETKIREEQLSHFGYSNDYARRLAASRDSQKMNEILTLLEKGAEILEPIEPALKKDLKQFKKNIASKKERPTKQSKN